MVASADIAPIVHQKVNGSAVAGVIHFFVIQEMNVPAATVVVTVRLSPSAATAVIHVLWGITFHALKVLV